MRKTIISIFLMSFVISLNAQDNKISLSIDQALNMALENNKTIKSAKGNEAVAKAELQQSYAAFLPILELSTMGVRTNDPLSSFGFKLKKEIVSQADFNPALLNDPSNNDLFTTKLELKLPLINLDGYYGHKAAKLNARAKSYQTERNIQYIYFEVKKVYYSLELTSQMIKVLEESKAMAKSGVKLAKDNQEQGYAKEADVLMAEVRLADVNAKLIEAQNMHKNTLAYFNVLVGLEENTEVVTTDKVFVDSKITFSDKYSLENRSDLMAFSSGIEARKNMLSMQKMKFVPRLNAFGSTEWNDDKFIGTSATNYTVGAMLSWKLFNGMKNVGGVKKASAQLNTTKIEYADYLEKNKLELDKANRDLNLASEQIKISELSKKQASESYRIIKNRYAQGLEKTIDLLYAENLASSRKLEYLQSLYKYRMAVSYLELLYEEKL